MLFNSYEFLLLYLPLTVAGYFIANRYLGFRAGGLVLLVACVIFYSFAGIKCMAVLAASIGANYLVARLIEKYGKKKLWLTVGVSLNVLLLLYFKYRNFFLENINTFFSAEFPLKEIVLPLGISFFTFQQIAYLVGIYRDSIEPHSFLDYAIFVLYFPKLVMGPLIEPNEFVAQLHDKHLRKPDAQNMTDGIKLFILGLFKKVLLADTFAAAANWGFMNPGTATSADWIVVMLAYTFQIYFDFSGYSDMAIGISRMLNIKLPVNFNSPYQAISLRDFWKRWHMSLTRFLTRYIYIPLGGNRRGTFHTYLNMFLVFLISGLWHGASWTFILWGILQGVVCITERIFDRKIEKLHLGFRWLFTFCMINVMWLLFRAESVSQWISILKSILTFSDTQVSWELLNAFTLPGTELLLHIFHLTHVNELIRGLPALLLLGAAVVITILMQNNCKKLCRNNILTALGLALLLVWSIVSLSGESTFVYFGF